MLDLCSGILSLNHNNQFFSLKWSGYLSNSLKCAYSKWKHLLWFRHNGSDLSGLFSYPYLYIFISTCINPLPPFSSCHTLSGCSAGTGTTWASGTLLLLLDWMFFQFTKQAAPLCQSLQGHVAAGKSQLNVVETCRQDTPWREEALTLLYVLNMDTNNSWIGMWLDTAELPPFLSLNVFLNLTFIRTSWFFYSGLFPFQK